MQISQGSIQFFNRLFNIYPTEWPRVLLMFLMLGLTSMGFTWGTTTAYANFLKQEDGLRTLPWVLISVAVLSILAVAVYSAFVDRINHQKLLVTIYVFGVISIVLGLVLLGLDREISAYPLLYLLALAWVAVLNTHFTTYANSFYDTQAAKRIIPVVLAGGRAGGIIAGLVMHYFLAQLDPNLIIVIWLFTYLIVIVLIWIAPYLLSEGRDQSNASSRPVPTKTTGMERQHSSYVNNMREGFRYTTRSAFLRWMALGMLLLMILMALLEYRSTEIFVKEFDTPEELTSFLALLVAVGNIIVLPMLFFGLSRLIAKVGLGNTKLFFPAGNLIICGGLIFMPNWVTASAAYLNRTAFRDALQYPIDNLLYNAVPLRIKGRARAFVEGLVGPTGSLVGGLILLLSLAVSVTWLVPSLIGILAVFYMISAWYARRQYGRALVEMLEQEDFSSLFSQDASTFTVADPAILNQLQKKIKESPSSEFTIFMAQLISQVGSSEAGSILVDVAKDSEEARIRSAIVDILTAANLRGETVRQLYVNFLGDADGMVRQSAITGLEQLEGPTDEQFVSQMVNMISDPDIEVRVRVLLALAHSGQFYQLTPAVQALDQLLNDVNPDHRAYGVRVLGEVGYQQAIRDLLAYLADPADQVRLEAALSVERLSHTLPHLLVRGDGVDSEVVEQMHPLLQDPVERTRQAAVVVLGRVGTQESYHDLVGVLTDSSPQVRSTAADTLVQIGKAVIPTVHPKLDSPDPKLRKMATVILSRINRDEFGPLVNTAVTGNLLTIYQNLSHLEALAVCSKYRSISVLQAVIREQNQQLIDEIFYFLAAIHESKAIETITGSLRSNNANVRANAAEALEALTNTEMTKLITPLFESNLSDAQLLDIGKDTWEMAGPSLSKTITYLIYNSKIVWLRALTAYALGEIGSDRQGVGQSEDVENGKKRRRRRHLRTADLIGKLTDLTEEVSDPSPTANDPPDMNRTTLTSQIGFTHLEIESMLQNSLADSVEDVRMAAQVAQRMITGEYRIDLTRQKEDILLSAIEKVIFLKEVPFFQGMTINQLEVLANICEEEMFEEDTRIFEQNDPGGALYVVVSGRVGIEREGTRKGSTTRLATLGAHSYFGEMSLFDNSPRSAAAIALQDTLTLHLRREPLIALARQYPDLSLELINVLSERLRESNDRIAELTRSRPREIQKLFDKLD